MTERDYERLVATLAGLAIARTGVTGDAAYALIDAAALAAADRDVDDAEADALIARFREHLATFRAARPEAYARHAARTQPN